MKYLVLFGAVCAAFLLGMYLNADGEVASSPEKVAFATIMLALNVAGIFLIKE